MTDATDLATVTDITTPDSLEGDEANESAPTGIGGQPYDRINPLYDRLHRLHKRRYWWLAAAIGGLVSSVGQNFPAFFVGVLPFSAARNSQAALPFILISALRDTNAVIAFLIPILIATIAAAATSRETTNESYDLILLTGLSNVQIVRAYIRHAFQRTRALWAFQIGLTLPNLVVAFSRPQFYGYGGFRYFGGAYLGQAFVSLLVRLSAYTPSLLIRVPWLLLALLSGVWLAQRARSVSGAMLGAMLGVFVAQFFYAIVSIYFLLNTAVNNRLYGYSPSIPANGTGYVRVPTNQEIGYMLLSVVLALIVPFVAWLLFVRLPSRVRQ